ncbi:enoyl-ACP reductase [Methylocystis sp.]|uniref:enoyl-ACP reductase FabI n=1 Tax=Methylocystis sp. TaxID=1911079 RepID=UPI002733C424|nr:SDR family oxidoreductase [Methylocystis sp.]MDP3555258.1 SDR family oxidoreductase [Methylocystis sp.]
MDNSLNELLTEGAGATPDCASPDLEAPPSKTADNILIVGTSGQSSIGVKIAASCRKSGIQPILTSRREKFLQRLSAEGYDARYLDFPRSCDTLVNLPPLKGVVYCLAKTDIRELQDGLGATSAENFSDTLLVSCYSFIELTRRIQPTLRPGSSIVALTFRGSSAVVPGYGLMGVAKAALEQTVRTLAWELGPEGVRVNALSAGAIATPSSRVLRGFTETSKALAKGSCLRRGVSHDEIAAAALWLLSRDSSGVTGETINVNGGLGLPIGNGVIT